MSDPLNQLVHYLNLELTELDVSPKVGVIRAVPVRLTVGPLEHETDLRVRITEEGWVMVDPEGQVQRIEREIRGRLQEPKSGEEGGG